MSRESENEGAAGESSDGLETASVESASDSQLDTEGENAETAPSGKEHRDETQNGSGDEPGKGRLDRIDDLPLAEGFLGGVVSFFSGYVVYVLIAAVTDGGLDFSNLGEELREVAYFFYSGHNIPRRVEGFFVPDPDAGGEDITVETGAIAVDQTNNMLLEASLALPTPVYFMIPILALVVVTAFLARRYVPDETFGAEAVALAVGLWFGYLGCLLVGSFLIETSIQNIEGDISVSVRSLDVLLYGTLYPLIVGIMMPGLLSLVERYTGESPEAGGEGDNPPE